MTYGGFKIIKAAPMNGREAHEKGYKLGMYGNEGAGYEVTYEDGYKSWSPVDVFEKAYTPLELNIRGIDGQFHPAIEHVLKFFVFGHLPPHLQEISAPFATLAYRTARKAPQNQETTVALRKLLEAKDAAVRAVLP